MTAMAAFEYAPFDRYLTVIAFTRRRLLLTNEVLTGDRACLRRTKKWQWPSFRRL
jgi:hypothetical protein